MLFKKLSDDEGSGDKIQESTENGEQMEVDDDSMESLDVGSFVVVRYAKKERSIFNVARVEHNIADESVDVCFYRCSGDGFILTQDEVTNSVERHDIHCILPEPQTVGGTACVAMKL